MEFISKDDMPSPARAFSRLCPRRPAELAFAPRVHRCLVPTVVLSLVIQAFLIRPATAAPVHLRAQPARSTFSIQLGKAGLFKVFGDNHLIGVSEYRCDVLLDEHDIGNSSVRIAIPAASLKVVDPKLAPKTRAEVQKRMEGPEVLDVARFPEISFVSQGLKAFGDGRFRVEGDLKIRDTTRPIVLEVSLAQEASLYRVRGEARIRQTAFGIRPLNVAGGTVKVKDEMKIVFDLVLAPVPP